MLSKGTSYMFLKVYEALLCIYIVIAPINNALNDQGIYAMVGYAAMLLLIIGTFCAWLGGAFGAKRKMGGIFTAIYLVVPLTMAGTLLDLIQYHGAPQVLLFAQFISLSKRVDLKKMLMAFYVSAIVSALFSLFHGWVDSTVSRTAAMVDGSIAPVVLAITLFVEEDFEYTKVYKSWKAAGMVGGVIVALFGMSRSRLLLIALMLLLKVVLNLTYSVSSGKVGQSTLLLIPLIIVAFVAVTELDVVKQLVTEIERRYEGGFADKVREMEAEAGWTLFKGDWVFGRGWKKILYKIPAGFQIYNNHNMYVTIFLRGGVVLAATMFYSFACMILQTIRRKNILAFVLLGLVFALGYGNAGVFNYTICSMLIPFAILLDQGEEGTAEEQENSAEEEENDENDLCCQG